MVASGQLRGHSIEYDGKSWVYSDTRTTTDEDRPCIKCGEMSTKEGYDPCLGYIEGTIAACCGHGIKGAYIMETVGSLKND